MNNLKNIITIVYEEKIESESVQRFFELVKENSLQETIETWCGNTRIMTISDTKRLAQRYVQEEKWWKAKFVIDALAEAKGNLDVVYLFTDNTACKEIIHELQEFRFLIVDTNDVEQFIKSVFEMKNQKG